jgi:hypothetical protein
MDRETFPMFGIIYKATSQRYLDITFSVSASQTVRVMEAPGRWMPPDALDDLVADLRRVAAKTLPEGQLDYGVLGGDPERLRCSIITLVSDKHDGSPVAFNALARMEVDLGHRSEDVLHLGLVMIDPDARSQGLSWVLYGLTCILMLFRNGMWPLWVSNVTQVPAVVGLVSSGFARVFPTTDTQGHSGRSLLHLLLARRIMKEHRHVFGVGSEARFDENRFVITNAYTGGSDDLKKTFEAAPKHRDDAVNVFCQQELNYERGDDFLQLGQIDLPTALSYVAREVPPRSFAAMSTAIMAAVLNRIALPIWHWFDTSREFGVLRARGGS